MFAVNGILFNHESPGVVENFVTRKKTPTAGPLREGFKIVLNLETWILFAIGGMQRLCGVYVDDASTLIHQRICIATGGASQLELYREHFSQNGITLRWEGTGIEEKKAMIHR